MTDKQLSRLSRKELVDIIYQLKKNEAALQARLDQAEAALADREIRMANAGSIAEAALSLNGVFEAAQRAAEDYLRSVARSGEDVDTLLAQMRAYLAGEPPTEE